MSTTQQLKELRISEIWAKQYPDPRLLILFGSRARGDNDPRSDWDIAFLRNPDHGTNTSFQWLPGADLLQTLSECGQIPCDRIDLIDMSTCSEMLAHFVAQEGQLIYERKPGEFERFRQQALKDPTELKQFRQTQREKVLQALARWNA